MSLASGVRPPSVLTATDLYDRGAETLLASWNEYARGADGAAVRRHRGVAAAVGRLGGGHVSHAVRVAHDAGAARP